MDEQNITLRRIGLLCRTVRLALTMARELPKSRSTAMVCTKLDEALLWLSAALVDDWGD